MRTSHLLSLLAAVLLAILWLGLSAPVLAQIAGSDTFLLGAVWINDYQQYGTCKDSLHMNFIFDDLTGNTISAAGQFGLWITGADANTSSSYYRGISGLGKWITAGKYWASIGNGHHPYDVPVWNKYNLGSDVQEQIPGYLEPQWVRSVSGSTPDTLLDSLYAGFMPFFWARYNTHMGEDLHHYYVRIYGRLTESGSGNPPVLTIKADWMSDTYHSATWNGADSTASDTFYASELGTSWSLTDPKELYVQNHPDDDSYYWRGNLSIYWTGERSLEIYYVTISDSMGDKMVFNSAHPYNAAIDSAANYYNNSKLFRHFMVDEPFWGQIWANAYIDSVIGPNNTPTTADLVNYNICK